jgi:hypothetical protein
MKKVILFIIVFAATGKLMAQNKLTVPLNNTLNGALVQPFKPDTTWRTTPLLKGSSLDNLSSLGNLSDYRTNKLIMADNTDRMPVGLLKGQSKMPVIKLNGNSKMPVVGKDLDFPKKLQATAKP